MAPARAQVWFDQNHLTIALQGDLAEAAATMPAAVAGAHPGVVTIDLTRVTSIDGHGIDALMAIADAAASVGAAIRYSQAVEALGEVIDLRGVEAPVDLLVG